MKAERPQVEEAAAAQEQEGDTETKSLRKSPRGREPSQAADERR